MIYSPYERTIRAGMIAFGAAAHPVTLAKRVKIALLDELLESPRDLRAISEYDTPSDRWVLPVARVDFTRRKKSGNGLDISA
jgi:hypothetical protein